MDMEMINFKCQDATSKKLFLSQPYMTLAVVGNARDR